MQLPELCQIKALSWLYLPFKTWLVTANRRIQWLAVTVWPTHVFTKELCCTRTVLHPWRFLFLCFVFLISRSLVCVTTAHSLPPIVRSKTLILLLLLSFILISTLSRVQQFQIDLLVLSSLLCVNLYCQWQPFRSVTPATPLIITGDTAHAELKEQLSRKRSVQYS
jgi:hypothetical protein